MEACFFDFHEIGDPPSVIKKPLTDRRVSLQDAQSASQNAKREKEGSEVNRMPCPGSNCRYLNTRRAAEKLEQQGLYMN